MSWMRDLLDLFFPRILCPLCGEEKELNFGELCSICSDRLPKINGEICFFCGRPIFAGECFSCQGQVYNFKFNRSWGLYKDGLKKGIYKFKYGGRTELKRVFAEFMADTVLNEPEYGCIEQLLAVPLHEIRLKQRGYNQAELLGSELAGRLGLEFLPKVLVREKNTAAQSGLSREERKLNLDSVFRVNKCKQIKNRTLLLVDDIFTTGATADACAQALLQAGSKQVLVITLAAGEYRFGNDWLKN